MRRFAVAMTVWTMWLAMVLTSVVVPVGSASAAVASAVSLGVSPAIAAPAESVVLSGLVSPVAAWKKEPVP